MQAFILNVQAVLQRKFGETIALPQVAMADKDTMDDSNPRPLSLFRLVVDQARVTEEVLNHPYPGSGTGRRPLRGQLYRKKIRGTHSRGQTGGDGQSA